jgi:hypothetical protein
VAILVEGDDRKASNHLSRPPRRDRMDALGPAHGPDGPAANREGRAERPQPSGATPYGVVGALLYLALMGAPFGFMAFLGIISLIGVIVSHVIVLFDFIEEMQRERLAVRAGGLRCWNPAPATGDDHGGGDGLGAVFLGYSRWPLWQPLCYAQIGGLAVATFITLLLVPVFYSIAVLDLRIVKWTTAS